MYSSGSSTALKEYGIARLGISSQSKVLVVGLGKTGFSIASFLADRQIPFYLTDSRRSPPLYEMFQAEFPSVECFLGGFEPEVFDGASHIVISPGVSLKEPVMLHAASKGVPIIGDLDLFAVEANAPVVAITGANGKSTVTTLVGLFAEQAGVKVCVGGNLGTPMLDLLDDAAELYVLELSSFQLETSHILTPNAATVLNISPDHMDRYSDIAEYANAKRKVFNGSGTMVINHDDSLVREMCEVGRHAVNFSIDGNNAEYRLDKIDGVEWLVANNEPLMPIKEVLLQGRHNLANVLAALALSDAVDLPKKSFIPVLREFCGLDHRCQLVGKLSDVAWVNDSKATNVGACIAALNGLDDPVVLIAGGDGKGADFSPLRDVVSRKVKAAVLMGRDADLIKQAIGDLVETCKVGNMREAVSKASQYAVAGDVVILAPACASLDQYKDYQQRGQMFAEEVRRLAG
jgi:UDP-N-acetylmuramoylalanine--D-glutamate ligase